jgi:hypothetical protein
MSEPSFVTSIVKLTPYLALLSANLLWTYFTLGYRVRKARKAFEKQLIQQGMSKEDAERLSACFEDLKNNFTSLVKQNIRFGGRQSV